MSKPRKHYSAVEKVAILRRHLLERVPVSDLCDQYHPTIDVLQLVEAILQERGCSFRATSLVTGEASRAKDCRPSGQTSAQERSRGRAAGGARQTKKVLGEL